MTSLVLARKLINGVAQYRNHKRPPLERQMTTLVATCRVNSASKAILMPILFSKVRRFLPVATCVVLLGSAGCGSRQYPVRGKVTLEDGTPVTAGVVVFESYVLEGKMPVMARGSIQTDRSYQLITSKGDGAPPGKYRVIVLSAQQE